MSQVPACAHQYIDEVFDPKPDGHCGFRCVAKVVYGDEDEWPKVRQLMLEKLEKEKKVLKRVLGDDMFETVKENIKYEGKSSLMKSLIYINQPTHTFFRIITQMPLNMNVFGEYSALTSQQEFYIMQTWIPKRLCCPFCTH